MTTDTKHIIDDLQARVLDGIRTGQAAVIDGVQAWSERASRYTVPKDVWTRTDGLPTPAEAVDAASGFAGQLLDAQRDFALALLDAAAPRTVATSDTTGTTETTVL